MGKDLRARIVGELGEEGVLLVYLYDEADASDVSVNSRLVSRGHAWLTTLRDTVEAADPGAFESDQQQLGAYSVAVWALRNCAIAGKTRWGARNGCSAVLCRTVEGSHFDIGCPVLGKNQHVQIGVWTV